MDSGKIIVGYQGIGKSTVASERIDYIDLESGNFWIDGKRSEDWYKIYCSIAEHLCRQGKNVFVSSHFVVREQLRSSDCKVVVAYPSLILKDEWIQRLSDRYAASNLEKDFKAWKNAEEKYDENIADLMSERTFNHAVIIEIPYKLVDILND